MSASLYAGIELGGTKTVCTIGQSAQQIVAQARFATTSAEATLGQVAAFLSEYEGLKGIGIAAFGPINVDMNSEHFGVMESTPKPGWSRTPIVPYFKARFDCPITLDTDVNAAGLAEFHEGAGQDLTNFVYITVGTGIGAGVIINGQPLQGLSHPEIGHVTLPRLKGDEHFKSACPFHPSCAEGLASGTAISARWGAPLNEWPQTHAAWDYQSHYLAELCHSLLMTLSPQKILVGGGVASGELLAQVCKKLRPRINGYVQSLSGHKDLSQWISLPQLGDKAGPIGALLLAVNAKASHA